MNVEDSNRESDFSQLVAKGPKVLLHDHLDGGLRTSTIIELAEICGYENLPSNDDEQLSNWFHEGANRRDLNLYLETFTHTVGVMQDSYACHRVAKECAEDLAEDYFLKSIQLLKSKAAPDNDPAYFAEDRRKFLKTQLFPGSLYIYIYIYISMTAGALVRHRACFASWWLVSCSEFH